MNPRKDSIGVSVAELEDEKTPLLVKSGQDRKSEVAGGDVRLKKELGLVDGVAIILGIIIGSGRTAVLYV